MTDNSWKLSAQYFESFRRNVLSDVHQSWRASPGADDSILKYKCSTRAHNVAADNRGSTRRPGEIPGGATEWFS